MIAKLLHKWLWPEDTALDDDDDDGACPACDHPFGEMNHVCFGPPTTPARVTPDVPVRVLARKRALTSQS